MLHVVRKKDTKEMVACWRPALPGEPEIVPVLKDDEEYVLLANMTYDSAMDLGRIHARRQDPRAQRPGRMFIHNNRVEADPPIPQPSPTVRVLDQLRVEMGKGSDEPLTWGDIKHAAGAIRGGRR